MKLTLAICLLLVGMTPAVADCGRASWYGTESGSRTANGEFFDGSSMTVAHKTLPFGTKLRVSLGGKSAIVRVNDRGPFVRGRELDLSRAVAKKIGLLPKGVAHVCWEIIK
jgi:rare lipoprotein A